MSNAELITATIGSFGFLLGLFNLGWMIRNQRPHLHVSAHIARFFTGAWVRQGLIDNERFEAIFLELMVEVSNRSSRTNTVTSLTCSCGFELGDVPEESIQTGVRAIQNIYESGPASAPVYWKKPEITWGQVLPKKLDSGASELLPIAYRIVGGPTKNEPFTLKVVVCDTFGRTYSTSVMVTKLPTDAGVSLLGEPAAPQE